MFANKQDLPNALSVSQIQEQLGLHNLRNKTVRGPSSHPHHTHTQQFITTHTIHSPTYTLTTSSPTHSHPHHTHHIYSHAHTIPSLIHTCTLSPIHPHYIHHIHSPCTHSHPHHTHIYSPCTHHTLPHSPHTLCSGTSSPHVLRRAQVYTRD